MSTKTIIAWIRGEAKSVEVPEVEYLFQDPTLEERINALENAQHPNIISSVTLLATNWEGDSAPYSQLVEIAGVTPYSKIDLQPTALQITELQNTDIALIADNNDGVVTVYALGGKPTVDYTMQALITEVVVV